MTDTGKWNFVDHFGADPKGLVDAAPLLQNAVTTICDAGGGTLVIPPGRYRMHSPGTAVSGTGVLVPDSGNLTVVAHGAHIFRSDTSAIDTLWGGGFSHNGYNGASNISIRGGRWDGGANNPLHLDMFAFCSAENILYEDLVVENIPDWHAIEFHGIRNGTARNCTFRGFKATTPTRFFSEAIEVQEAPDGTHSTNIVVDGCSADGFGALVGTHTATFPGRFHDGIRVVNNRITNAKNYAVRAQNWRHAVIANNIMADCNSGIQVQVDPSAQYQSWFWSQTENIIVSHNVLTRMGLTNQPGQGPRYATIGVYGMSDTPMENVVVTGNIIRDWASSNGIALQYVHEAVVTGNVVKYSQGRDGTAILFSSCSGGTATGNNIRYAGSGVVGAEVSAGNRISLR
ncbi:hypothetical protein ADK86_37590 [Streptomyces sp. NRRL F-5755]|uniref:NosD domain-containing protein n=1 Tax=Streptomyces sp. NRRL F-5755 TaxID=1519475 RepID=UPI0006AF6EEA|nr:NosD domain-containing protein [Streptomyces sp. NRRL F-5755]KOT86869.1 hypothetical protein ADK86_37590 [Streptomyces sp. NRRL F-5755]